MQSNLLSQSASEVMLLMHSFELERCVQTVCPEDEAVSVSNLNHCLRMPPPQKFLTRTMSAKDRQDLCKDCGTSLQVKDRLIKSMGELIIQEESARWTCGVEEYKRIAGITASLIAPAT